MRISYATLAMLAHAGYPPAMWAKEDWWKLVAHCTRPIAIDIICDHKAGTITLEPSFRTDVIEVSQAA